MKVPLPIVRHARRIALVALLAAVPLAGCDDPFDNQSPLPTEPTPASLADFRTADLSEATAFQVNGARTVAPSQSGVWDFVFWIADDGDPQFRARDMIASGESDAGLAAVNVGLAQLEEAPQEGYATDEPVPADSGAVYAVRGAPDPNIGCRYYAKIEVVAVDTAAGTVTFEHLVNPNCGSRNLLPGDAGLED